MMQQLIVPLRKLKVSMIIKVQKNFLKMKKKIFSMQYFPIL